MKGRRARELQADPLPVVSPLDWADPEVTLAALYRRAEKRAIDTIENYRRRSRGVRLASRALRAAAVVLAGVGLLLPLLAVARDDLSNARWCMVFFAAALALLAAEHLGGLSTTWQRDLGGARRAFRRLEIFQAEWTSACAPGAPDGDVVDRLSIIGAFSADLRALTHRDSLEGELDMVLEEHELAH